MKWLRIRLWVVALACVGAGLTSRLALAALAPPQSRAQAWEQWSLQVFWYAAGLLLFLGHVWHLGTSGRPKEEVPGCAVALLWVSGAVVAFLLLALLSAPGE